MTMRQACSAELPGMFNCPIRGLTSSRNLVVCIDGTSNQFGTKNTNIVEFYSHIMKNDTQLTYYSSGLGAIANIAGISLGQGISNTLDMAFGWNLHKVIVASYRWLSDNYQDGDRIFLFGFSRGAYQVRALAGMIARVGLLLPGNNEQIPFAFEVYSKTDDHDLNLTSVDRVTTSRAAAKESKEKGEYAELAKTFKKTFCQKDAHIHFVGAWDTVSSVGVFGRKTMPYTTSSQHICYFRHALALDERRVKFLPEYVYGGRSICSNDERVKEVWFPGSHSDVGGGNRRNERLQSGDIPLLWMRSQAISSGLEMLPADVMWTVDDLNKSITRSLHHAWWLVELFPLKRLLYFNSDKHTFRPHLGRPRKILPGQKVHASALLRYNYKPHAQFYYNPEGWAEPMVWNDAIGHERLQRLSDMWEKDTFDGRSVKALLDHLTQGELNLDALDRLAFIANFDLCKNIICNYKNARQIFATCLRSGDAFMRLSAAATYCELGWDWPQEMTDDELGGQITNDVAELLQSNTGCCRACMYIPALCTRTDLKERLLQTRNLRKLVKLCGATLPNGSHDMGENPVAFHSAYALSTLMKLDVDFAEKLIGIGTVTDIMDALHFNCNSVLLSVLSVIGGLAKHESGREVMKTSPIIARLLRLIRKFDDFVTPAALRVLCSLLSHMEIRRTILQFGVLPVLLEVLDRSSDGTKRVACDALVKFMQHDDIRDALRQGNYLRELAKRVQSKAACTRDGAIMALVDLGKNEALRTAVAEAIKETETVNALVGRLNRKSTALSAASALAHLVKIDDVGIAASDIETGAHVGIVKMLLRRWFDSIHGEDGYKVLSQLLECERLRPAILEAGATDVLRKMVESDRFENTYAGLHYLRIIAGFGDGKSLEALKLVVKTLCSPRRRVQRIAMEILRFLSTKEGLRVPIAEGLLGLLDDRRATVVFAVNTLLQSLAAHASVRKMVVTTDSFSKLTHEYSNGLTLEYDDKNVDHGGGISSREVYESVGHMIKSMRVDENGEARSGSTEDCMERG